MLNIEQIKEILPHRAPFLLLDTIEELTPGRRAVGLKHVRDDDFWVPGHFPGQPVMPGVLIVEALAQAGAVAVLSMPENKGKIGFLGGVKAARFRRMVVPGDTLRLEVEMTRLRAGFGVGAAVATVDGETACTCEITFALREARSEKQEAR